MSGDFLLSPLFLCVFNLRSSGNLIKLISLGPNSDILWSKEELNVVEACVMCFNRDSFNTLATFVHMYI